SSPRFALAHRLTPNCVKR
ncbi:hypothetical protein D037_4960B, partial [Vibrio parahaemolyticus IDH02640]